MVRRADDLPHAARSTRSQRRPSPTTRDRKRSPDDLPQQARATRLDPHRVAGTEPRFGMGAQPPMTQQELDALAEEYAATHEATAMKQALDEEIQRLRSEGQEIDQQIVEARDRAHEMQLELHSRVAPKIQQLEQSLFQGDFGDAMRDIIDPERANVVLQSGQDLASRNAGAALRQAQMEREGRIGELETRGRRAELEAELAGRREALDQFEELEEETTDPSNDEIQGVFDELRRRGHEDPLRGVEEWLVSLGMPQHEARAKSERVTGGEDLEFSEWRELFADAALQVVADYRSEGLPPGGQYNPELREQELGEEVLEQLRELTGNPNLQWRDVPFTARHVGRNTLMGWPEWEELDPGRSTATPQSPPSGGDLPNRPAQRAAPPSGAAPRPNPRQF